MKRAYIIAKHFRYNLFNVLKSMELMQVIAGVQNKDQFQSYTIRVAAVPDSLRCYILPNTRHIFNESSQFRYLDIPVDLYRVNFVEIVINNAIEEILNLFCRAPSRRDPQALLYISEAGR